MQQDRVAGPQKYAFVLREGTSIRRNFLDYSLLLLHTQCHEMLRSPTPLSSASRTPYFRGLMGEVGTAQIDADAELDFDDHDVL